jgi:hypothetical protein
MTMLEAWKFHVPDLGIAFEQLADHTFVKVPAIGKVLECWGGTVGPGLHMISSKPGSYNWANCYRCPAYGKPDTACIGIYGVGGVCHQSANCFLYSTGDYLSIWDVRGAWFTYFTYGVYGVAAPVWYHAVYEPCAASLPFALTPDGTEEGAPATSPIDALQKARDAQAAVSPDPNLLLVAEQRAVTTRYVPELAASDSPIDAIQLAFLGRKDELVATGYQGNELAYRMNDLARSTQVELRAALGDDLYKSLMAVDDASITLGIIEPGLSDVAGLPIPEPVDEARFVSQVVPAVMTAGERYQVSVTMRNDGTTTWRPGRYTLGSQEPADTLRWGISRVGLTSPVTPGAEAVFTFEVVAPAELDAPATFRWKMVRENVRWFGERNLHVAVTVVKDARFVSQQVPAAIVAGTSQEVSITMRNISGATWPRGGQVKLGSQQPEDNATWGTARVTLVQDVPNETDVTFRFPIRAPAAVGQHDFQWRMVREGTGWLGQRTPNVAMRVMPPIVDAAVFVSQIVPSPMHPGSTHTVAVTMRNAGTSTWSVAQGYKLGSQGPMDNTRWGLNRVALPHDVPPNAEVTFSFAVHAHDVETFMGFQWQMLRDGVGWFGQITSNIDVRIAYPLRGARPVRQTVPRTMSRANPPTATVTVLNTGEETWTPDSGYKLGSQNPLDNVRWGTRRVSVPHDVPPNTEVIFAIPMLATAAGTKDFQWKMLLDGVAWFGTPTANVTVTVT